MIELLRTAAGKATPPVSGFSVGAVAAGMPDEGRPPALYLGANLEFGEQPLDATIHAEYSDINTVRQSQEKRGERSLVLVEGSFDTTDELMLYEVDDAPETPGTLVEAWGLELPADTGHTLRYMPPETTENTVLWVRTDAGWQQADTSVDGSYLTCTAPAGTTAFAAVQMPASKVPLLAAACGAAAALLLVILFIARKRKKRKAKKAAEKAK